MQLTEWINALTPFEKGYLLGQFHAKQEEGRYLSDISIKDLSYAERRRLVIKAFDIKASNEWKHRTHKNRQPRRVENSLPTS